MIWTTIHILDATYPAADRRRFLDYQVARRAVACSPPTTSLILFLCQPIQALYRGISIPSESSALTFITGNYTQFVYYDALLNHPDWSGKKVFDFGGNTGNILKDPACTIEPWLYWCLDVSRDAIRAGQAAHPEAHFVFYDRYSYEFNPGGRPECELPYIGSEFDFILALSVFTHMSRTEMVGLVRQLRALLAQDATLAFTMLDPHFTPDGSSTTNLRHYGLRPHDPRVFNHDLRELAQQLDSDEVRRGSWFTLINDDLFIEVDPPPPRPTGSRDRYLTLYTEGAIREVFPGARVLPPATGFPRQYCCLLVRADAGPQT